jgi:hypothetical protein
MIDRLVRVNRSESAEGKWGWADLISRHIYTLPIQMLLYYYFTPTSWTDWAVWCGPPLPGCRATGLLGRWAVGTLGRWAVGTLGRWAIGLLGRWAAGPLGRWAAGPLGRWAAGPLGHWAAWLLGC